MTAIRVCPACVVRECGRGKYLCYECWHELPLRARRALKRTDLRAVNRLQELHRQIARSVPLDQIEITP